MTHSAMEWLRFKPPDKGIPQGMPGRCFQDAGPVSKPLFQGPLFQDTAASTDQILPFP